jgi:hypothetical protein
VRARRRLVRHHHFEDERRGLVCAQRKLCNRGRVDDLHRDRGAQPQCKLSSASAADEEHLHVTAPIHRMCGAAVVEARVAPHHETYFATDRLRAAHKVVRDARVLHGHEVGHLGHAGVRQEPREQYVGIRQVQLRLHRVVEPRRNLEKAAAIGVDERRED